jgi:actin related protein 2/3 complex subunit 2
MPPPLNLEFQNRIIHDTVVSLITATEKPEPMDITIADFNQVLWHMTSDGEKVTLSVSTKCWGQLNKYSTPHLKTVYGPMMMAAEPKYDVTIGFKLAEGKADPEKLANKVASLARNVIAGPFLYIFEKAVAHATTAEMITLDYRPQESIWLKLEGDRVIAIYGIYFDDTDDAVIGKVFLQEMGKLVQGAPAVDVHIKDPPRELAKVPNLRAHGYASFLLEGRHFAPKQRDTTINFMVQFRNYVHYHLKCSKAYLHIRMRNRVQLLLQVLNRAKQEKPASEKGKGALMFGNRK